MSAKNTSVFGLYPDEIELVEGIEELKRSGFRVTDLSVLLSENLGSKDIGHEKHTKAPEGAVAGGIAGAVIGAALGWLSLDMTVPSVAGAGPVVVAILAGTGALGTLGAIAGAVAGACRPEYEAKRYQGRMRSSGILLSVHCDNAEWRARAKNALRSTGAEGIASGLESKANFGQTERPRPRAQMNTIVRRGTFLSTTEPQSVSHEPPLMEVYDSERGTLK